MGRLADPWALEHCIQLRTPRYKYLVLSREAAKREMSVKEFMRAIVDQALWMNVWEEQVDFQALATGNQFGWVDVDTIDRQMRRERKERRDYRERRDGLPLRIAGQFVQDTITREEFAELGLD